MRITNNMLMNNMINYIGNNLTRMDKYQSQLATGKKISVPSDDPVVAARALKLRTDVAEIGQYQKNTKDAQSWLDTTEDTLAKMGDILHRTRELAVQGANGTNTQNDTQKIEEEVKQLRTQMIQLGNSTYAGRYIFSGYKTDTKLIDETTGMFNISVANSENIKYEIGVGDDININVTGGDLFNNGAPAVGTTSGITTGNNNISSFTFTAANNGLSVDIDGTTYVISITPGTYTDANALAAQIETQLGPANVSVAAIGNKLQFESTSTGPTSSVVINTGASTAANTLGLSMATNTQINGTAGTSGVTTGNLNITTLIFTAANNGLSVNIDGTNHVINITPGTYASANALAAEIQTQLGAGIVTVAAVGNKLQFTSASTGPASSVVINTGASTAANALGLSAATNTQVNGTTSVTPSLIADFDQFINLLNLGNNAGISNMLDVFDDDMNTVLRVRADVGARSNRIDLTCNRLDSDEINFTKLMSTNEDVDMVDAIMNLQNEENVYKASLSGGARIIQPTLLDFLR